MQNTDTEYGSKVSMGPSSEFRAPSVFPMWNVELVSCMRYLPTPRQNAAVATPGWYTQTLLMGAGKPTFKTAVHVALFMVCCNTQNELSCCVEARQTKPPTVRICQQVAARHPLALKQLIQLELSYCGPKNRYYSAHRDPIAQIDGFSDDVTTK